MTELLTCGSDALISYSDAGLDLDCSCCGARCGPSTNLEFDVSSLSAQQCSRRENSYRRGGGGQSAFGLSQSSAGQRAEDESCGPHIDRLL